MNHLLYNSFLLTPDQQFVCPAHNLPLKKLSFTKLTPSSETSTAQFLCSSCKETPGDHVLTTPSTFQTHVDQEAFSISFGKPSTPSKNHHKFNFLDCQLEHVIINREVTGYSPRNLTYIPHKNLLGAADQSGTVLFWSVKDSKITFTGKIEVGRRVNFIKFLDFGNLGKRLAIATNTRILFYNMDEEKPLLSKVLECQSRINDLCSIPKKNQLATVHEKPEIQLWDANKLSPAGQIDLKVHEVDSILTVAYSEKNQSLVCETAAALYLIPIVSKDSKPVHKYSYWMKRGYGMGFLPKTRRVIQLNKEIGVRILNAKDLTAISEYKFLPFGFTPGVNFIANEDESQFIANVNANKLQVFFETGSGSLNLGNLMTRTGGLAFLEGQGRFAVADQSAGIILIFTSGRKEGLQLRIDNIAEVKSLRKGKIETESEDEEEDNEMEIEEEEGDDVKYEDNNMGSPCYVFLTEGEESDNGTVHKMTRKRETKSAREERYNSRNKEVKKKEEKKKEERKESKSRRKEVPAKKAVPKKATVVENKEKDSPQRVTRSSVSKVPEKKKKGGQIAARAARPGPKEQKKEKKIDRREEIEEESEDESEESEDQSKADEDESESEENEDGDDNEESEDESEEEREEVSEERSRSTRNSGALRRRIVDNIRIEEDGSRPVRSSRKPERLESIEMEFLIQKKYLIDEELKNRALREGREEDGGRQNPEFRILIPRRFIEGLEKLRIEIGEGRQTRSRAVKQQQEDERSRSRSKSKSLTRRKTLPLMKTRRSLRSSR